MLGAFALSEKFFWMVIFFEMVKLIEVLDNKYQERGFKNVDVRFLFFPGSSKTASSLISQLQGGGVMILVYSPAIQIEMIVKFNSDLQT